MRSFLAKRYYKKWIAEIAESDKVDDLDQHFIKHANELNEPGRNAESWAASMRNLIDIYEHKHEIKPSIDLQIRKLENHYRKHPETRMPPPGEKVPSYVKETNVPKFNK